MSDADQKTVDFWKENLRATKSGETRPLNFWSVRSSILRQRAIAFPEAEHPPATPAIELLRRHTSHLATGLSIGCGSGHKELELVCSGLVDRFTLVEVVPELIEEGRRLFAAKGVSDRAEFVLGDFRQLKGRQFDLLYFDNALHHMSDVASLIPETLEYLKPGGFFFMDDFVGPTYNQFEEEVYAYAEHVRRLLPASFFEHDPQSGALSRIPVQAYLDTDPSEACDSGSILPALAVNMPGIEIIPTGGLIYYLAGREIFHELQGFPDRDDAIIRLLYELDRVLVRSRPDLTCYALATWQKTANATPVHDADWRESIRWPAWGLPF